METECEFFGYFQDCWIARILTLVQVHYRMRDDETDYAIDNIDDLSYWQWKHHFEQLQYYDDYNISIIG